MTTFTGRRPLPDPAYLAKVRKLPCCAEGCKTTDPREAHHMTGGGMGTKVSDRMTMPLCRRCHRDFHALAGRFKGWERDRIRSWQHHMVIVTMGTLSATKDTEPTT